MSFAQSNSNFASAIYANKGLTLTNSSVLTFADNTTQSTAAESISSNISFTDVSGNFVFNSADATNYEFTGQYQQTAIPTDASGNVIVDNTNSFSRRYQTYISAISSETNANIALAKFYVLPDGWTAGQILITGSVVANEVGTSGASPSLFLANFYVAVYADSANNVCIVPPGTGTGSVSFYETYVTRIGALNVADEFQLQNGGASNTDYSFTLTFSNLGTTTVDCNFSVDCNVQYIKIA